MWDLTWHGAQVVSSGLTPSLLGLVAEPAPSTAPPPTSAAVPREQPPSIPHPQQASPRALTEEVPPTNGAIAGELREANSSPPGQPSPSSAPQPASPPADGGLDLPGTPPHVTGPNPPPNPLDPLSTPAQVSEQGQQAQQSSASPPSQDGQHPSPPRVQQPESSAANPGAELSLPDAAATDRDQAATDRSISVDAAQAK